MSSKYIPRSKAPGRKARKSRSAAGNDFVDKMPSITRLRGKIMEYFREHPNTPVNYKQIAAAIGVHGDVAYEVVSELVASLSDEKIIQRSGRGKYFYKAPSKSLEGIFRRTGGRGHNSFVPDDGGAPIRIAERNSRNAMDGDRVVIQLHAKRRGTAPEGEVVQVIERVEANFVGRLEVNNGVAFLLTESNKLANDIFIPDRFVRGAKDGDKVIVRVVEWKEGAKNPVGEVIDVIGRAGENDTEMHAILAEFGLPYVYPKEVEEAADRIDEQSAYDPKYNREDFREAPTLTIDPKEAKDFDDALSYRVLEDGNLEVGVHIADVTAYVHDNDIIDKEAQKRATSVYLVDRTVPMLPERLCNDLCSLRPNEDRPAFSVIFKLDKEAKILDYRIVRTVIHSDARLAYEEAQAVIEGGEGVFKDEILALNVLAQKLRAERFANNAIDFDRSELKFEIDEAGKPIAVKSVVSKEANKLIEEFMLLANRTVARHIGKAEAGKKAPVFVYRVHDLPDPEKLQNLSEFVMRFGYKLKYMGTPSATAKSINALLDAVQGKPEEKLVETITIRTMAKATYTVDNIGHYGLGFEYYTHFTSPIRRHPDMLVHRLLTHYLAGGKNVDKRAYEQMCEHDSAMENTAAQAERASIKYKQVEYMMDRIGQEYEGVISGVTDWGLYVEIIENGCEGLVSIRELDDDYYEFDVKNYCLRGFHKKKTYSLGEKVTIRVADADLERKQLDFTLV